MIKFLPDKFLGIRTKGKWSEAADSEVIHPLKRCASHLPACAHPFPLPPGRAVPQQRLRDHRARRDPPEPGHSRSLPRGEQSGGRTKREEGARGARGHRRCRCCWCSPRPGGRRRCARPVPPPASRGGAAAEGSGSRNRSGSSSRRRRRELRWRRGR